MYIKHGSITKPQPIVIKQVFLSHITEYCLHREFIFINMLFSNMQNSGVPQISTMYFTTDGHGEIKKSLSMCLKMIML